MLLILTYIHIHILLLIHMLTVVKHKINLCLNFFLNRNITCEVLLSTSKMSHLDRGEIP